MTSLRRAIAWSHGQIVTLVRRRWYREREVVNGMKAGNTT
jgi:hypothetical protein